MKILALLGPVVALITWSMGAQSIIIEYDTIALGGDSYQNTYTVINDDIPAGVDEFAIYFDLDAFSNLVAVATPAGWDPLVIQPDPALPDNGIYDALALAALPIGLGETLGGFSVSFDWLGVGSPGPQNFDIIDSFSFEVIANGSTRPLGSGAVPEPSMAPLFLAGFFVLIATRNRSRISMKTAIKRLVYNSQRQVSFS